MSDFATRIETHGDALLQRWVTAVQAGKAIESSSRARLQEQLPPLLTSLILALRRGSSLGGEAPAATGSPIGHFGFDVQALVREYRLLGGVLLDLAEASGTPMSRADVRVLTDFMAAAVADGVAAHGMRGTSADVTSRKEAELAREGLLAALEAQPFLQVCVLEGPQHVVTLVNAEYRDRVAGGRDILGKPVLESFPELADQGFDVLMKRVLETGEPYIGHEVPILTESATGVREEHYFNFVVQPVRGSHGQFDTLLNISHDVTHFIEAKRVLSRIATEEKDRAAVLQDQIREREQVEEELLRRDWRLRYAIESARLTYVEVDLVRGGARTPENFASVMGYTPPPEQELDISLGTRMLLAHVVPEDRARVTASHEEFAAGKPSGKLDYRVLGDDNVERWIETRWSVEVSEDGRPLKSFATNLDITERKRVEEALRASGQRMQEADQRKDEFLAMLAHELRNPLAPVVNMLEVLKRSGSKSDLIQPALSTMERQLRHMTRMIDDLLDASRISQGKISLRREIVDIASLLRQVVDASRIVYEAAQQKVSVTLPAGPLCVHADAVRLAQVFGNLLQNASKFSRPEGRILVVAEQQGGEVVITIKDSGIGIPSDMLPRIFDLFMQGDQSLERAHGGLGIGLTLVRQLVEMHEGSVQASSEGVDRGSEFVVRLPALIETREARPTKPTNIEPTSVTSRRILVVDDNRDSATSLALLLRLDGNETHVAFDGEEAVEAATSFRPDVILMDIGLPKLNGFEAAGKIRTQPSGKAIVLVALTGWGQPEDRQKTADAGFDAHLVKPVDYEQLTKLLASFAAVAGAHVRSGSNTT